MKRNVITCAKFRIVVDLMRSWCSRPGRRGHLAIERNNGLWRWPFTHLNRGWFFLYGLSFHNAFYFLRKVFIPHKKLIASCLYSTFLSERSLVYKIFFLSSMKLIYLGIKGPSGWCFFSSSFVPLFSLWLWMRIIAKNGLQEKGVSVWFRSATSLTTVTY